MSGLTPNMGELSIYDIHEAYGDGELHMSPRVSLAELLPTQIL